MENPSSAHWQWVWVNSYYPGLVHELKDRARAFHEQVEGTGWSPEPLLKQLDERVNDWRCGLLLDTQSTTFQGHVIAWVSFDGVNRELYTLQCEIQGSYPGAFLELIRKLEAWGREKGATRHRMITRRDPASYLKVAAQTGQPGMVQQYLMLRSLKGVDPG